MSWDISGNFRKFILICPEISGDLLNIFVNGPICRHDMTNRGLMGIMWCWRNGTDVLWLEDNLGHDNR